MKYLVILAVLFAACQTEKKKDVVAVPNYFPACDTLRARITYLEGNSILADSLTTIVRCGMVDSAKPKEFAKVSSVVVTLSSGKTINPEVINWSSKVK